MSLRCVFGRQDGFILVFMAVAVPALLALVGLALDGLSLVSLDTRTANLADAAALAAANRLDRSAAAIPAARAAALALVNEAAPSWRGEAKPRLRFRFARTLADLRQRGGPTLLDSGGPDAEYVEVQAIAPTLTTSFLQLVGAGAKPILRRAVAESHYFACDVTPALLCSPDPAAFAAKARPGQQYLLRMDGNTVAGSVGLLDRPDRSDARQVLRTLADDAPGFCYADGVALRRNIAPADYDEAINVRFDHYAGRTGPIAPDLVVFPPAPDIIQGRHPASCVSPPQGADINPPYHLPRDSAYGGIRLTGLWDQGTGDWKIAPPVGGTGLDPRSALEEYLAWNHANKGVELLDRFRNAPTRYDLYLAELGLTRDAETTPVDTRSLGAVATTLPTGGPTTGPLSLAREHPAPFCYAGARPATAARRRILYFSLANCAAFPEGATAGSLSRHVAKFFLTEPTELGATLVEFVAMLTPGQDDGKFRHVVQLVSAD
ncbi:pilus assembly protein TadG-related protein [Lichenihabitans sp. Uapishka_5]|uniref:pilus assembly protein TadG-related protein n=1 Tax=Lichenihabitans sp. Uapishka_5 TaxID=3037302 RepID=UPI0029E812B0|nr:pilus assembly protein TadG-related protein [Lichenihabitans sp. Uapishka_5]MDX7951721.1 pilus assembly protein TadG-related protein [Lichenihabitans sp. Uapishka_5]